MPYIDFEQRARVREDFAEGRGIKEPGDLAYIVADALDQFVGSNYRFADLAAALGAVESARSEFYNNVVTPYEAQKRRENGECFMLSTPHPVIGRAD